jgi:Lrp/AsnC family transcriptional regulator, leucine-responsive regulatory protein
MNFGGLQESRVDTLDRFDRRILAALQRDARMPNVALADAVHLSASQCARRLQRLEDIGAIRGYRAIVDPVVIGLGVIGIVTVTLEKHAKANVQGFRDAVARCAEITECLAITGDGDFSLRVACPDLNAFSRFLMDVLMPMPGIATTRSSIVLESLKDWAALPIDDT